MIRGTTAPFKIKLPYNVGELEWVTIKWWQDGNKGTQTAPLPITKKLKHCLSNVYTCKLSSDIVANEQYYFIIDNIMYTFTAPQNIYAGSSLKYDASTKTLTAGALTLMPSVVEKNDYVAPLNFINEAYESNELNVFLTASETMRFSDKHKAKMQLRARRASDGRVFGCTPRLITVYPINEDLFEDDTVIEEDNSGWVVLDGEVVVGGDSQ